MTIEPAALSDTFADIAEALRGDARLSLNQAASFRARLNDLRLDIVGALEPGVDRDRIDPGLDELARQAVLQGGDPMMRPFRLRF